MAEAKQKAPAKPKGEAKSTKDPVPTGKKYVLGDKPYNPKAAHNVRSWEALQDILPATMKEMTEALSFSPTEKHTNFIGYMVRGNHIANEE